MKYLLFITSYLIIFACSESSISNEATKEIQLSFEEELVCFEFDDFSLSNLSIDEFGKIHNSILSTLNLENPDFNFANTENSYSEFELLAERGEWQVQKFIKSKNP